MPLSAVPAGTSPDTTAIGRIVEEILQDEDFRAAAVSVYAVDNSDGTIIYARNPDMALRPGSTLKLLSTASALELLGPAKRFPTYLAYTGKIDRKRHILYGDMLILGRGDPTIDSKYFPPADGKTKIEHWVEAIRRLGIDSIAGGVIGDASYFSRDIIPPTWSWKNIGNYFGAGPSGLCIRDNMYALGLKTGHYGDTAQWVDLDPPIPGMEFDIGVVADSIGYDNAYIYGAPYTGERYVRGELPLNRRHFVVKGSMPEPALQAAQLLDAALRKAGIGTGELPMSRRLCRKQSRPVAPVRNIFDTLFSPPLSAIITQTNTHSINLFAEQCMMHAGIALGAVARLDIAIDSVLHFWQRRGLNIHDINVTDGSGLSQYDTFTARQMVFLLRYMKNRSPYFDTFYRSLPLAGKTGTLKNMFRKTYAKGRLRAKSGSVDRARAYAGYVKSKSGRDIIFAVNINNFSCSSRKARRKLAKIMDALANL